MTLGQDRDRETEGAPGVETVHTIMVPTNRGDATTRMTDYAFTTRDGGEEVGLRMIAMSEQIGDDGIVPTTTDTNDSMVAGVVGVT